MKIRGAMITDILLVMILETTLVLFITLPISQTNDNILVENIFGLLENQKERVEK